MMGRKLISNLMSSLVVAHTRRCGVQTMACEDDRTAATRDLSRRLPVPSDIRFCSSRAWKGKIANHNQYIQIAASIFYGAVCKSKRHQIFYVAVLKPATPNSLWRCLEASDTIFLCQHLRSLWHQLLYASKYRTMAAGTPQALLRTKDIPLI